MIKRKVSYKRMLTNISKRTFNTPLYVTEDSLSPIVDYVSNPERTLKLLELSESDTNELQLLRSDYKDDESYKRAEQEYFGVNPETLVGTIDIKGTLVNKAGQTQACVELTSYESLKHQFSKQIELGAEHIVMQIDSGGGEAYRCFGTINSVIKMLNDNNVKTTAYVDGGACSAAYAWASLADEIVVNPMGRVGSVGVVTQLINNSKQLEQDGLQRTFVYAGKNKIPFTDSGEFSETFINDIQESIDKSYDSFTTFISKNRSMSKQSVIDTDASVYDAEEAISIGFADKIMEIEEFDEYIQTKSYNQPNNFNFNNNGNDMNLEDLQKQVASLTTELETSQASLTELTATQEANQELLKTLQSDKDKLTTELADSAVLATKLQGELDALKLSNLTADRKSQLTTVLGTQNDQVDQLLTTTMGLDDTAFSAIVTALTVKNDLVEKEMIEQGNQKNQEANKPSYTDSLKEIAKNKSKQ